MKWLNKLLARVGCTAPDPDMAERDLLTAKQLVLAKAGTQFTRVLAIQKRVLTQEMRPEDDRSKILEESDRIEKAGDEAARKIFSNDLELMLEGLAELESLEEN